MTLATGTHLGPYEIVAPIGAGGMGEVYRARDSRLGRELAVKVLPPELASDPQRRARFEQEAKAASGLNHPNIVTIHDIGTAGATLYVAMELVEGRTLRELLASGRLAPEQVIDLAAQMAAGLAKAHQAGIVHRDLKPDNVIVSADGHLKILDFGLAKVQAPRSDPGLPLSEVVTSEKPLTEIGTVMGTVAYMSPEQAQAEPIDARSDVFSLGTVWYEMASGQRPFRGDNSAAVITSILRDAPTPLGELAPETPQAFVRIVDRCLEKDRERRYTDAAALRGEIKALRGEHTSSGHSAAARAGSGPARGRWIAGGGLLAAVVLAALGRAWFERDARERWLRNEALPQLDGIVDRIQGLQEGREAWDAFVLARKIEAAAPADPLLKQLRPRFSREVGITSDPPGATVQVRYYDEPDAPPVTLGRTPLEHVAYPLGFTRLRLELAGRPPVEDVLWNHSLVGDAFHYRLPARGELPDEMAWVPGGAFEMYLPGLDHLKAEPTTPFLMDRHEVTNREYKRFVDAGGYAKKELARFVDRTGRPGPATWEVGSFPDGRDDFPVAGVSWYEAAAYAAWAGKSLPTIFHWNRVAFTVGSSRIVPFANIAGKDAVAVGGTKSANRFGVSDLAGNVREWTWNSAADRGRYILGGGWNDPDYAFADTFAQPATDRSPTNGFRCIRYLEKDSNLAELQREVEQPFRDLLKEKPVPDAVFAQFLRQFAYDKTPLDAKIEEEKKVASGPRQKISFTAAYGNERMTAYLFLPTTGRPPYQVVVLFPGSGSITTRSSETLDLGRVDFLQKGGRAVLFPIYKSTYERGDALRSDYPSATALYKDHVIMWAKDLSRSIDYLETRTDIDASRVAYYGLSWGAALGAILPAVEPRIKANVLYVAGMAFQRALPEAEAVNYVTRVKQPTLMLNGELDFFFPAETSQRPMFELLGTPAQHKKRLVFPGGHSVPRTEMIKESLAWLDRYLGPVDN
jgi:dienelactone hydrolase